MEHRRRKPRRPAALGPPLGLSAGFSPALSLGLPTSCAGCGRWETTLCPRCRELLEAAPFAVEHADAADDLDIWALASYTGPVRTMVLGWKNGAREDLSEVMARSGRHLGRRWAQAHPPGEVWTGSTGDARVLVVVPAPSGIVRRLRGRLVAAHLADAVTRGICAQWAGQEPAAARVLLARAVEVGAVVKAEGPDFGLLERHPAVGGQVIRIQSEGGPVGDLFLPLHGAHMARNAALAVASVEAFLGGQPLDPRIIEEGLASVVAPARLELVRTSPAIVVDTAHNPQAARVTIEACREVFAFQPLIGVIGMMADKDAAGVLEIFASAMDQVVVTRARGTSRSMPVDELVRTAEEIWPAGKVQKAPSVADALELATLLADAAGPAAGVLVAGSLIVAGEARDLLVGERETDS
mgnify:CR=1 FL=1